VQPHVERQIFDLIHPEGDPKKPRELSWYEYVVMLLQIGAAIEHALMVQYLYAAYSLSSEEPAKSWRETLLGIAREEMGHLLQVQNILTLLGGPFNLERGDYPWDVPFDAFPFQLEPLTQGSLACYVYAEMPGGMEKDEELKKIKKELDAIQKVAENHVANNPYKRPLQGKVGHVGTLYDYIIRILGDRKKIPDIYFRDSELGQFSWDEWGRNYRGDPKKKDDKSGKKAISQRLAEGEKVATKEFPRANLLIQKVATREEAIIALAELSEQGEGLVAVQSGLGATEILQRLSPNIPRLDDSVTHFQRLLAIYREYPPPPAAPPYLQVPTNPTTDVSTDRGPRRAPPNDGRTRIENKRSVRWAGLFNLRYRMLLAWLAHALTLVRRDPPSASSRLCGQIVHRVFGEMYNMKAIAEMLVHMPLTKDDDPRRAGPPFEMPFRTVLPPNDHDMWQVHKAAIVASRHLCCKLREAEPKTVGPTGSKTPNRALPYLDAIMQADEDAEKWIDGILYGRGKLEG
jgi:rubrerythrin